MKTVIRPLLALLLMLLSVSAKAYRLDGSPAKVSYPGGKFFIFRYMLTDKQATPFRLDQPQHFLSKKAIERRRRQHLLVDSTDLPVSPAYVAQFQKEGAQVVGTSRWNNSLLVRSSDSLLLQRLGRLECVRSCCLVWESPDSIVPSVERPKVHEEFSDWERVPSRFYGNGYGQIHSLGGDILHEAGFRGEMMTVAVFDGGFRNVDRIAAFSDAHIVGTRDFVVPRSTDIYGETDHGTRVLSVLAAHEPNVLIGSAPKANYWLLRCEDAQSEQLVEEDYWAMAAEFADSAGVDVVSSSLGYSTFDHAAMNHHYAEQDGRHALISRTASMMAQKGMVLVSSAGNAGMKSWKKILFPADADNILTVGAISANGENAPFSSIGPTQDGRVKPDVMAFGSPTNVITGRGTLSEDVGTSFATPIVAGLVACLWQALPHLTAADIIQLVRQSSSCFSTPNNIYGYGIPDFWQAYVAGQVQ